MQGVLLRRGEEAPALVDVRALGGFEVTVGDREIGHADWQRVAAERLFKLLIVAPGHRISREAAAETLWPEAQPEAGRASLRKALHFAHHALEGSPVLVCTPRELALDAATLRLDVDRLAAALGTFRANHGGGGQRVPDAAAPASSAVEPDRRSALATVIELGPLELLPEDPYEDWLVGPRERLRSEWQRVALEASREAWSAGRVAAAHEIVDQLLARDPTDEAAHRLAIRLYADEGRHHAARRQFELCRKALREALDAEPEPETVAACREAGQVETDASRRAPRRLVGRRAELEQVGLLFDRVADNRVAGLVIRGQAGIGKSRLLDEVAAYARSAGWQVLACQAVEALRDAAFGPLRMAVASGLDASSVAGWPEPARSALATLVTGLGTPRLEFQDRPALIAGLIAAITQLARGRPVLIAVDDLPWLDPASLELLASLLSVGPAAPILVAGTIRDDEGVPDAVGRLAELVRRASGLELHLGPLHRREIDQLVLSHLGGDALEPMLGDRLADGSGGNPLFCLELVRAAVERGDVRREVGLWRMRPSASLDELPGSARSIAARRLSNLPPSARDVLRVAAELGPTIGFEVLAATMPADRAALIEALDAALASGLIVELGAGYAFAHPLYRLAVRSLGGPGRRSETRLAIARALAGTAALRPADSLADEAAALCDAARACANPLQVADHALAAAELGLAEAGPLAVAFGFEAGDRLVRLHDHDSAREILGRSVGQWRRLPAALAGEMPASTALTHLARLQPEGGPADGADVWFREAIAAARDPVEMAGVYDAYWEWVPYRRGDFAGCLALVDEGLTRLPPSAVVARAHLEAIQGWTLVRLRRFSEALPCLAAAVAVLDPSPDTLGAQRALDSLGMTLHYLGRTAEGRVHVERALAVALESGSTHGEVIGNLHLGILLSRSGECRRARPMFGRAAELSRMVGDVYGEALACWGAAEAADELGDASSARELRLREIGLLGRLGGNPHNEALAHAHLANLARRRGDAAEAARTAAEALRLARESTDADYPARIERAIGIERWADLES